MRKFGLSVAIAAMFSVGALPLCATDIPIFPVGNIDSQQMRSLTWGTSGAQGFNNNFFFTPLYPNGSVCISVFNNNTTSSHPFSVSLVVNYNPSNNTPSDATWQIAASSNLTAFASPGLPAGIGTSISGVARVSINLTGSTTLGGSPETANVVISQTPGNCFSGNASIGSAPNTVSAVEPIQAISEGLSQGFHASTTAVNAASGQDLLTVNANGGTKSLFFNRAVIGTTSASGIQVNIVLTGSAGTTCTAQTITNLRVNNATASTALAQSTCTTHPSQVGNSIQLIIPANGAIVIDLSGIISSNGGTTGINVASGQAVTGTTTTAVFWYEK